MTDSHYIIFKEFENYHSIIFNRPEKRNALNKEMRQQLISHLDNCTNHLPIIFSAKGSCFCAGLDLKEEINASAIQEFALLIKTLRLLKNKTIAIIDGSIRGGGLILASSCNQVFATQESNFGMPDPEKIENKHIKTALLSYAKDDDRLMNLVLKNKAISTEEAIQLGLVHKKSVLKSNLEAYLEESTTSQRIKIKDTEILSDNWYILNKVTYDYRNSNGEWETHTREAYDRGNGATILLYNKANKSIILTRQFRLPTFINGNDTGMLIEACAGLLDKNNPEDCIRKETEEETGYKISEVTKIFESYMSPGSVTEILYFFIAEYTKAMKVGQGGGLAEEQENIEVLELNFDEAFNMIYTGEIKDGKTIMLLQYAKIHNLV